LTTDKAGERAPLELALLRDEMLSRIPAFDTLLRRSERVSILQKMLAQGNVEIRAGNFLIVSYRELRILEIDLLKALRRDRQLSLDVSQICQIDVSRSKRCLNDGKVRLLTRN